MPVVKNIYTRYDIKVETKVGLESNNIFSVDLRYTNLDIETLPILLKFFQKWGFMNLRINTLNDR